MPEPERPAPPAPPIETIQNMPEPPKDEYIDIPIVEHGSLESLIKKGPDDAFNSSSADYQTDKSLEAIIKKGPDNDLGFGDPAMNEELNEFDNTQQETYQSGHNFSDLFGGSQNHISPVIIFPICSAAVRITDTNTPLYPGDTGGFLIKNV